MSGWRKLVVGALGAMSLVGGSAVSVAADEGGTITEFDSMTTVTGTAVGTVNDRGILGGGVAWKITSGAGSVDRDGHVSVSVKGLVLVPTGTNPISSFRVGVSCITTTDAVAPDVVSGPFAATSTGDSTLSATLALPHPCTRAEVFVGGAPRGTFIWFAQSNPHD